MATAWAQHAMCELASKQQLAGTQFATDIIIWLWTDDTDFF